MLYVVCYMNILIIYQFHIHPKDAGITRFSQFAKYWADSGHKVRIIAGMVNYLTGKKLKEYQRKLFVKEIEGKNIEVLRTFTSVLGYRTFWGRLFSYFSFIKSSFVAGLFSKADVIIVVSPPIFIGIVGYLLSCIKRKPFIFEIRDLWPDEAIEMGIIKNKLMIKLSHWLEKFLYRKAKLIIGVTPGFREFLINKKKVDSEKITIIPNPADLNLLKPQNKNNWVRQKFNWQDKFIVLYIGAHSMVYNFSPVIETAKNLKNKNSNILFVFVGDGKQKPVLIEKAKKENLKNIQFLDPIPKKQIGDFINASDVCIATLKKMNLLKYIYPAKLFDYMACAKPIILAMNGVSKELVCKQAKCGICIEPENATEFEKAVIGLYNNSNKIELLGKSGYNFVRQNFSDRILAEKYINILEKLI